jgi:hypothetical protein
VQNKVYILLSEIILRFPEHQSCVHPCLDILFRILKNKKYSCEDLIENINSENFMTSIYIIIHTHECNMKIMTNLFSILCLINDKIDSNDLCSLFSFSKLREIFNIHKNNGFDIIHELIIHVIKNLTNKNQEIMKLIDSPLKKEHQKQIDYFLTQDQILEILLIFINFIQLMKNKIIMIQDMKRSSRIMINMVNNIYILSTIIMMIIENCPLKIEIINNFRVMDYMINLIIIINEKGYYNIIDEINNSSDGSVLNNKILILKKIFIIYKIMNILKDKIPTIKVKKFH